MSSVYRKVLALTCLLTAAGASINLYVSERSTARTYDLATTSARTEIRAAWDTQTSLPAKESSSSTTPSLENPAVARETKLDRIDASDYASTSSRTDVVALLTVPRLGSRARELPVRLGTSGPALDLGAALYPNGVLPGSRGNLPIVGHRTSHGKPFEDLDRLRVGDEVIVETASAFLKYHVFDSTVVDDEETWVLSDSPVPSLSDQQMLTLITCTPKGSTSHRIVVFASLRETVAKR